VGHRDLFGFILAPPQKPGGGGLGHDGSSFLADEQIGIERLRRRRLTGDRTLVLLPEWCYGAARLGWSG
jgi:hypothetical protein